MPVTRPAAATRGPAAQGPPNVASMNPDNMVSAGLKDDFDGMIEKVRFIPWDYDGKLDHHILSVAVTIRPDGEDVFTQNYSAGELEHFAPSMDGYSPVPLEDPNASGEALEGIYALRVGSRSELNNSTNWAQFVTALIEAGFDKAKLTASVAFAEGTYGHFNRIPQKKRSGIVSQQTAGPGGQPRRNDILVITEIKEAPIKVAPAKGSVKPQPQAAQPQPATVTNGSGAAAVSDLDAKISDIVVAAIAAAGDEGLPKAKLGALVIKGLAGADKAKGVRRVQEAAFLSDENAPWLYDAESGTLFNLQ